MSATIATIAKKLAAYLIGDEKGRKIILYSVCIALFVASIPLITLLGMFSWAGGDGGDVLDHEAILSTLPSEQLSQFQTLGAVCDTIATEFESRGLDENDRRMGTAIYFAYLVGLETQDTFYADLANCFLNASEDVSVYDLIYETFSVEVSESDQAKFDQLYGVSATETEAIESAS